MARTTEPGRRREPAVGRRVAGHRRHDAPRRVEGDTPVRHRSHSEVPGLIGLVSVITAAISAYAAYGALNNQVEQQRRGQAEQVVMLEMPYGFDNSSNGMTNPDGDSPRIQNYSRLPISGLSVFLAYKVYLEAGDSAPPAASYAAEFEIGSLEPCEQALLTEVAAVTARELQAQLQGQMDWQALDSSQVLRYIDAAGNIWFRPEVGGPTQSNNNYLFHGDDYDGRKVVFVDRPIKREPIPSCTPG